MMQRLVNANATTQYTRNHVSTMLAGSSIIQKRQDAEARGRIYVQRVLVQTGNNRYDAAPVAIATGTRERDVSAMTSCGRMVRPESEPAAPIWTSGPSWAPPASNMRATMVTFTAHPASMFSTEAVNTQDCSDTEQSVHAAAPESWRLAGATVLDGLDGLDPQADTARIAKHRHDRAVSIKGIKGNTEGDAG